MAKGFVDKVLTFMGIQEETVEESDPAPIPERPAKAGTEEAPRERRGRLISISRGHDTPAMSVVFVRPRVFDEVESIAATLKDRRPVVVSVEACERDVAKRIIDFMSGATYALDGHMKRVADDVFLFTPSHVSIEEEAVQERLREMEPGHEGG